MEINNNSIKSIYRHTIPNNLSVLKKNMKVKLFFIPQLYLFSMGKILKIHCTLAFVKGHVTESILIYYIKWKIAKNAFVDVLNAFCENFVFRFIEA